MREVKKKIMIGSDCLGDTKRKKKIIEEGVYIKKTRNERKKTKINNDRS